MNLKVYLPKTFLLCTSLLLISLGTNAQMIYNMSNMTVDECKGILLDSENGDPPNTYDHNENLTFSICLPGVPNRIGL